MRSSSCMAKKRDYPAEEQGIEAEETAEELEQDMETGGKEADVYSSKGRKVLRDGDEVDDWEDGFMEGAEGGGQQAKCMRCGKDIKLDQCVEKEIDGELKWYCSMKCLTEYEKKKKK